MGSLSFEQAMQLLEMRRRMNAGGGVDDWVHRILTTADLTDAPSASDYDLDGKTCIRVNGNSSAKSAVTATVATGGEPFTIAGWIRKSTGWLGSTWLVSLYNSSQGTYTSGYALYSNCLYTGDTAKGSLSDALFPALTWTHLAVVYPGTPATTARVYVNGALGVTVEDFSPVTSNMSTVKNRLYLNGSGVQPGAGTTYYWDIRTYARALSADDVSNIYNATKWE